MEISKYAAAVGAFYLIILSNFLKELVGCRMQSILDNKMYAKHILGICMIYFLIILTNPEYVKKDIVSNIIFTILIYIWFLITSRCNIYITIVILLLIIIMYINNIYKVTEEDKNQKEIINKDLHNKIDKYLSIILLIVSIIGFIIYINDKKSEYNNNFSLYKFIVGKKICKSSK